MLNYIKKRQKAYFLQTYDDRGKPKFEIYKLKDILDITDHKEACGYGKVIREEDNILHLYPGEVNLEHIKKYNESRNKNKRISKNLEFRIH